jgi:AcrR family transcriptional regulator
MSEKPYHHGNLRNSLIEAGIELINSDGEKQFSLRKVAALCGVSHAAPYSHFKSKEDLLYAMQEHVTKQFMQALEDSVSICPDPDDIYVLIQIGKAYVSFFIKNPHYFSFLFSQSCIEVNLSMDDDGSENYAPFELLRKTAFRILTNIGMPDDAIKDTVISMWATVHGLACIATMKDVHYDKEWESKIEDIIWNKKSQYSF